MRPGNPGLTRLIRESEDIVHSAPKTEGLFDRLETIGGLLDTKRKTLESLDKDVLRQAKIEDIEQEVEESSVITEKLLEAKRKVNRALKGRVIRKQESPNAEEIQHQPSASTLDDVQFVQSPTQPTEFMGTTSQVQQFTQQQLTPTENSTVSSKYQRSHQPKSTKPKLPKLHLPKFKGDVTKWGPFWDSFESSIDKAQEISSIDKFNYLNSLLEGEALRAIRGLSLTSANYKTAIEILKERFGKPQQIISAHMDEMSKLPSLHSNSRIQEVRSVLDRLTIHVRGLETLGVDAQRYGSLLIPIVMSKLPPDIRLNIARKTTNAVWEIRNILKILKVEVEAREASVRITTSDNNENRKPWERNRFNAKSQTTTGVFYTEGNNSTGKSTILCVFCSKPHFSASCEEVRETGKRKDILRRDRRCFLCLKRGHRVASCDRLTNCRNCNKRHHQSICDRSRVPPSDPQQQNTSMLKIKPNGKTQYEGAREAIIEGEVRNQHVLTTANFSTKTSVVLQTATAYAQGIGAAKVVPVRILFDSGSQRTYITKDLKNRLGLKTIKNRNVEFEHFWR